MFLAEKRQWMVIGLCLVLLTGFFVLSSGSSSTVGPETQTVAPVENEGMPAAAEVDNGESSHGENVEPTSSGLQTGPARTPEGQTRQTVFRLVLENDECRLEAVDTVTGYFRKQRGSPEPHAGTIACRLLDSGGQIVAEKFVHAPDHVCAVVDPNLNTSEPKVALLSGVGPQVFQVRFPNDIVADKLEIRRITQTKPQISSTLLLAIPVDP